MKTLERSIFMKYANRKVLCRSVLAAAFCWLSLNALQTAQAQAFDSIERQRTLDMLKVMKDDLKKNYYDQSFRGLDVDARFKAAEEKLKQATSLGQALGTIAQVLLDLNDSH